MVPMLLSSCPVWDSWSPASLFAGRPFTPWGSSSQVASRFEKVTHSYAPGSIRAFVILRMPALCSLTSVSDWRSRTGGPWHAAFCPISSRSAIGSTSRRPSFRRRSDQPTHNTRGRQSASFPGCTEAPHIDREENDGYAFRPQLCVEPFVQCSHRPVVIERAAIPHALERGHPTKARALAGLECQV